MKKEKNIQTNYYGDEAPAAKDVLVVELAILLLIGFSWIAYFKLGWFH